MTATFDDITKDLRQCKTSPVYLLHGKEGYYIDALVKQFEQLVPEDERDYALTVLYAPQTEAAAVVDVCRQLPMLAERQVVILKEAQGMRATYFEKMLRYLEAPTPTTIFVIASRGEDLKSKTFINAVNKVGTVFLSKPVYESQIAGLIAKYIKSRGLTSDPKAQDMLADFIGNDLSRLYNEIDKLVEILGPGAMITPEAVERNIGVSKDYNSFELTDAVAARNLPQIYKIVNYFAANPRQNPVQPLAAGLFAFFADLLVVYYLPEHSDGAIKGALGQRNDFALRRVRQGLSNYTAFQVVNILSEIRRFDLMSKGCGTLQNPHELLRDLMFRITTTTGR